MHNREDVLAESLEPNIGEYIAEFRRAHTDQRLTNRITEADQTRFSIWDGQSSDGKKHSQQIGEAAFPWEGANDTRIRLADEVCNFHVALCNQATNRSELKVSATEMSDLEISEAAQVYMQWILDAWMFPELGQELRLHAGYTQQYGWSMLHVVWDRTRSAVPKQVTLQQLAEALQAQGVAVDPLEFLESQQDFLTDFLKGIYPTYKKSDIKKLLTELRETGKTTVIATEVTRNQPKVVALRPYHEVLFPPETTDIQRARCIMRREFYTVADIEQLAEAEEWDPDFVDAIKKTKGMATQHWDNGRNPVVGPGEKIEDRTNLIEIVYGYSRRIDENGLTGIYLTIFSPLVERNHEKELYAKHVLVTEAGDTYPFECHTREMLRRCPVESRGIPELIKTWQNEYKVQADAQFDNTSLTVLPPLLKPTRYGQHLKLGPAVQIPEQRPGDIRWLNPPSQVGVENAKLVQSEIRLRVASYCGLPHPEVSPVVTQIMQQDMVNNWTSHLACVYRRLWELVQTFGEDAEFQRVTGLDMPLPRSKKRYDFQVSFDVKELDPEFLDKKLQAVTNFVLPSDTAGTIDRTKLTLLQLKAIDPSLAKFITMDAGPASQKLFDDVNTQVISMALGNEAMYKENDPTAATKLQFLQSILQSNPKYQQKMSDSPIEGRTENPDPLFVELVQKYVQNLQMSVMQDRNKQIGRLGVSTDRPMM